MLPKNSMYVHLSNGEEYVQYYSFIQNQLIQSKRVNRTASLQLVHDSLF